MLEEYGGGEEGRSHCSTFTSIQDRMVTVVVAALTIFSTLFA